jgi:predicted transcriptional regulator
LPHGIRRRTWRDIIASVLECLVKAPSTRNKIVTSTNLNRDTAGDYLQGMVSLRLVRTLFDSKEHTVYAITEKGRRWLKLYKSLLAEEGSKE